MAELIGATVGIETLAVAASIGAAAYTGAVIGSIAVAGGRVAGCGSRIADMFACTHLNNLRFEGWHAFYVHHSEVLDEKATGRRRWDFGPKTERRASSARDDSMSDEFLMARAR